MLQNQSINQFNSFTLLSPTKSSMQYLLQTAYSFYRQYVVGGSEYGYELILSGIFKFETFFLSHQTIIWMIFAKVIQIEFLCAFDTLPAVLPGSVHAVWYRPQSFHRREKSSWGQEHRAAHQNHHDPLHPVHTLCPVSRAATNDYCNHIVILCISFFFYL